MFEEWIENTRMLVGSAAAIVPADGCLARVRACRFTEPGFQRETMQQMAEMGWLLLRINGEQGGIGLGLREYCELMRVLGRGLVPEPLISSILACTLLHDRLTEEVLSGERILVAAWQDAANDLSWQDRAPKENPDGGFTGRKVHVPGAAGADCFAVLTGFGVALVPRDAPGLTVELATLQDGCFVGTLVLENVEAAFTPAPGAAAALDEATLAQAAYLLGVTERAMELTLDYLRIRKQFDRPIGSFQALQHRMTEIKIRLELVRAGIGATARRMDAEMSPRIRRAAVSRAKAGAADLVMHMAREAVQMHGAIGYTDEADIGLFVRKAMAEANHFGSARLHRARYFDAIEKDAA